MRSRAPYLHIAGQAGTLADDPIQSASALMVTHQTQAAASLQQCKMLTTAPMHKIAWYFSDIANCCATTGISKLPGTQITCI